MKWVSKWSQFYTVIQKSVLAYVYGGVIILEFDSGKKNVTTKDFVS